MDGEHKGRVIGYAKAVTLRDAHTVVSEAGRQRVLREKRKNVHAYIDGKIAEVREYQERLMVPITAGKFVRPRVSSQEIYYNPYRVEHFVWLDDGDSTEGQKLPAVYLRQDRKVEAFPPTV